MRYRKICTSIWNDARFMNLSDDGKLAFMFLLTHPHMTSLGAMRATIPGLAAEIGWTKERFSKALPEAFRKPSAYPSQRLSGSGQHYDFPMVVIDEKWNCVWLPNFLKHNAPESPNVVKSWSNALEMIPECSMKSTVISMAVSLAESLSKAFAEALPKAFRKGMANQEQEQEQEQEYKNTPTPLSEKSVKVPCEEIAEMFIQICADLPCPKTPLNEKRKKLIRARHKKDFDCDMEKWRGFFLVVHASDWLNGRVKEWKASFDWILKEENFIKINEGNYNNTNKKKPSSLKITEDWRKNDRTKYEQDATEFGFNCG